MCSKFILMYQVFFNSKTFNWYSISIDIMTSHFQIGTYKVTTFLRRYARSITPSIDIFIKFFVFIELPPCMIWSKLSLSIVLLCIWFSYYHFVHTLCGKLSSCHESFVILWSTLVIAQLVSLLISYTWIMIHGTNSLGY